MCEDSLTHLTYANGLRLVHLHRPGAAVGYFGVMVRAGSRDEAPDEHGLAHFVEHTIFKGTDSLPAMSILNRMESIGGELNAYTTKEETVVYTVFPGGNLNRAARLVADLVINSRFPAEELDREREVVADEIDSYLDQPSEAVFDDFEELIFAGNPLAHNILGRRDTLTAFTSERCRAYLRRWYVPGNMVAFYAGPLPAGRAAETIGRAFATLSGHMPVRTPQAPEPRQFEGVSRPVDTHQAHTVIGAPTGGFNSPDRYAMALFTNIIGGPGMNSMLNIRLRERLGLVYNVEASTDIFTDCGLLTVYYGCDPADNRRCERLVRSVVRSVADGAITPARLQKAKRQYLGQMILSGENVENRILGLARQTLLRGYVIPRAEVAERINSLTCSDIADFAASLQLSRLTLGPV